jgi:predicted nicotinamide N-methyase
MTTKIPDPEAFVRASALPARLPLVPELCLHLATEVTPLWQATEATLERTGLPPPYWAFAWVGGQALARHILDHPQWVEGKVVLDFAAGSGVAGLAALRAGARRVIAADIDSLALTSIRLNAGLNGLPVPELRSENLVGRSLPELEVILAGDVCYERPMAEPVTRWLRTMAASGRTVLLGDPGRAYLPSQGLEALAHYLVPTSRDIEDQENKPTTVWRVLPD